MSFGKPTKRSPRDPSAAAPPFTGLTTTAGPSVPAKNKANIIAAPPTSLLSTGPTAAPAGPQRGKGAPPTRFVNPPIPTR